jgi:chromate transporter
MLTIPLVIVLLLAAAFSGVSDLPQVQGALRGMGAVAAGLITATGLKLVSALKHNALGQPLCWTLALATFVSVALLRVPLLWVLLCLGGLACAFAARQLRRQVQLARDTAQGAGDAP